MGLSESLIFNWEELSAEEKKKKQLLYKKFIEAMGIQKMTEAQKKDFYEELCPVNDFIKSVKKEKAAEILLAVSKQVNFINTEKKKAVSRVQNAKIVSSKEEAEKKCDDLDYLALKTQMVIALDLFGTHLENYSRQKDDKAKAAAIAETIKANLEALYVRHEDGKTEKKIEMSDELIAQAQMAVEIGEVIKKGLEALGREMAASASGAVLTPEQRNSNLNAIMKMQLVNPSFIMEKNSPELEELNPKKTIENNVRQ